MTLILSELQISTPVLKQLLPQLQELVEQTKKQTPHQEQQLSQIQQTVSQLTQPVPIKPGWVKVCGLLTLYAISTACIVVLMLRFLLPQLIHLNGTNHPQSVQKKP